MGITKRCVNWWMTRGPLEGPSPPFLHSLKAAAFYFLPHMLFTSTALAFSCRFLGYNTIWPIGVIVLHTIVTCFLLHKREEKVRAKDGLFSFICISLLPDPESWCLDTPLGLRGPCTEANLTWDDFAFPILPILVGLGIYCLIDSILSFWKDRLLATT